jgi:hypothetical protein
MIKVIIVAFGVLAIASFAASCWHGVNLLGLFRTTHSTVGHVIARETKARRGRGSSYTPVVLYRTDDGIEFKVTGKVYSSYVSANVGDVVAVRYDPANPATAVIATFSELWLPLLLWAGFSLMWGLSTILGITLVRRNAPHRRRNAMPRTLRERKSARPRQIPGLSPIPVIVGVFSFIAIGLGLLAVYICVHQTGPSTGLMVVMSFAWAFAAMTISVVLAVITSDSRRESSGSRRGQVAISLQHDSSPPDTTHLTGSGVEIWGSGDIEVQSRLPAGFLFAAACGLAIVTMWLYAERQTTLMGGGIGVVMAYFIGCWGWNAWPRIR